MFRRVITIGEISIFSRERAANSVSHTWCFHFLCLQIPLKQCRREELSASNIIEDLLESSGVGTS